MKQDVIDLCIEQASATIRDMNDLFLSFVRELGGAKYLPKEFTLDVPAMTKLERDIDNATAAGDLRKTQDLCDEYRERFTGYIAGWKRQIAKGAKA